METQAAPEPEASPETTAAPEPAAPGSTKKESFFGRILSPRKTAKVEELEKSAYEEPAPPEPKEPEPEPQEPKEPEPEPPESVAQQEPEPAGPPDAEAPAETAAETRNWFENMKVFFAEMVERLAPRADTTPETATTDANADVAVAVEAQAAAGAPVEGNK
eukprot:scaffold31830_cov129-Isochrysis_galbana.AAC.1